MCSDHDIARAVLFGSGDAGKRSKNPDLKAFSKKASAQSAYFSRSVIEADRRQDMLSSSGSESSEEVSDGNEQERANRIANNLLAHRCLTNEQFRHNDLFESVLDRAKEVTLLVQDAKQGWGEGRPRLHGHRPRLHGHQRDAR